MGKIPAIYRKEMTTYFASPLAYIFIMSFLMITGYFFWYLLVDSQRASMRDTFGVIGSILLFVTPILTMRVFAEERRSGTLELLMTSPVSSAEIVIGKFLATFTVYGFIFLLTLTYPVILRALGRPEFWPIASGYLGLCLMAACYTAVGLFASSLTENQLIAGIVSFGILLGFLVLDWLKNYLASEWLSGFLGQLSFFHHYEAFSKGVLTTPDLAYFVSFIFAMLFLTVRSLEVYRNR